MTTESKKRKNPDYSESAVNLCNPPEVKALIDRKLVLYRQSRELQLQREETELWKTINRLVMEQSETPLSKEIDAISPQLLALEGEIYPAIEKYGSYQDVQANIYAIKQRKVSLEYHVFPFKRLYPQYVPAVIVETINVQALNGLIKGGLLDKENLKHPGEAVITESESFTFIIK